MNLYLIFGSSVVIDQEQTLSVSDWLKSVLQQIWWFRSEVGSMEASKVGLLARGGVF